MTTIVVTTMTSSSSSSQNNRGRRSTYSFQKQEKDTPTEEGKKKKKTMTNSIAKYATAILRGGSESKRVDAGLSETVSKIVSGNAVYIEGFHCEEDDFQTLEQLAEDLDNTSKRKEEDEDEEDEDVGGSFEGGVVNWSKHLKQENPEFSETFRTVVERMASYFDVDVYATRLNFYRDGSDWKPYHHDSHAFGANGRKEDFTMGASFGAQRALSFLHEPSASSFEFPQKNGDVFAFSSEVNAAMQHGVPRLSGHEQFVANPRFSVIAWGRRRSLNPRNSAASEEGGDSGAGGGGSRSNNQIIGVDETRMPWHSNSNNKENEGGYEGASCNSSSSSNNNINNKNDNSNNERVMSNDEVSQLVREFVKRKRNETRKTSNALVAHLRDKVGINDSDIIRVKKQARKYQRGEISVKEFVQFALGGGGRVSVDVLKNLCSYLPNEQKKVELTNELENYSDALPFLS